MQNLIKKVDKNDYKKKLIKIRKKDFKIFFIIFILFSNFFFIFTFLLKITILKNIFTFVKNNAKNLFKKL